MVAFPSVVYRGNLEHVCCVVMVVV